MKVEELFDQVDINGKANLLWEHGELISTIDYYNQKVILYLVEGFYAELYYSPFLNEIVRIERSTPLSLNKFLKLINLQLL